MIIYIPFCGIYYPYFADFATVKGMRKVWINNTFRVIRLKYFAPMIYKPWQ